MSHPVSLLSTSFGQIAVRDTGGSGLPVVMLHGAGSSSTVFSRQFGSPLAETRRLIAVDLPGHGDSDRARHPETQYRLPAVADLMIELLDAMALERTLFLGWSLGGHIGIEMMSRHPERLAGVMVCGAPPLAHGSMAVLRAFHMNPTLLLLSKPSFSLREARHLAHMCFSEHASEAHIQSILTSDGIMRTALRRSLLHGDGADQKQVAETSPVPLALVNGGAEPVVRLSYLAGLDYANLWDRRCHVIAGAGHAPFYTSPHAFNAILHRFAVDLDIRRPVPEASPERKRA